MYIRYVEYRPVRTDWTVVEVEVRLGGPIGLRTFRTRTRPSPRAHIVPVHRVGDFVVVKVYDAEQPATITVHGNITKVSVRHPGGAKYNERWATYTIPAILVF